MMDFQMLWDAFAPFILLIIFFIAWIIIRSKDKKSTWSWFLAVVMLSAVELFSVFHYDDFNLKLRNEAVKEYTPEVISSMFTSHDPAAEKERQEKAYAKAKDIILNTDIDAKVLRLHLGMTELPPEIKRLSNLVELDLQGNRLESLPIEITELPHLRILGLIDNNLKSVPKEVLLLENLEELRLQHNLLTSIPAELGKSGHLKNLNVSDNLLRSIPPEVTKNIGPEGIYLKGNRIN